FTNSSCDYTVTYLPYAEELFVKYVFGDANKDGRIGISDLIRTKKVIVESGYSPFADSNRDGAVSAFDLEALTKHLLEITEIVTLIAPEDNKEGAAQDEADVLRQTIANAPNTVSVAASAKKTYYVDSDGGNDANSGTSSSRALKTIDALSLKSLNSGDVVLLKRGSVFRTSAVVKLVSGVSYGTYGTGAKPIIKGSLMNYANATWVSAGESVWKLASPVSGEAGIVTFDYDTAVGFRKMSLDGLNKNGDYYHDYEGTGDFYLYLDGANPSTYFNNIEIGSSFEVFSGIYANALGSYSKSDITVNNISLMYFGSGIRLTYCTNINITGCEFNWIGGTVAASGNTRKGNGITIWTKCNGVNVDKCLFNQIFDAGFTFQGQGDQSYRNVSVTNSIFAYNSMNFEFWGDSGDNETTIRDITFSSNIVLFAGLGFGGIQRQHKTDQGVILGWEKEYDSNDTIVSFVISNNIFDTSDCYIYRVSDTLPISFSGNKYYQGKHSFTINRSSDIIAVNQATLEAAIATFDSNPALVRWLS
ncbi:MAG: hypothetical protein J5662_00100, partial [Clostridia bacterium]|nr:hypothetical protein [Clostridia bacterium]